jgi:hypothetical protein
MHPLQSSPLAPLAAALKQQAWIETQKPPTQDLQGMRGQCWRAGEALASHLCIRFFTRGHQQLRAVDVEFSILDTDFDLPQSTKKSFPRF